MRYYGYDFIKGSGADYKARNLIEAVVFGGIICFPLLILVNINLAIEISSIFVVFCFVFALISLLAEMLPKTALSLSLIGTIIGVTVISINLYNESFKIVPDTLNIINLTLIIIYLLFVSVINTIMLKNLLFIAKNK
jgi:hypothetical protein